MDNSVSKKAYFLNFIMFFTYAFFAVNRIAATSLTPVIMEYFKIEKFANATFITNAITVAKIMGNFAAARLLYKLYPKKAIALGSFLIAFGSFFSIFAKSYALFIVGRFIMGFGGALFVVYFSPLVINYFDKSKRPFINAVISAAYNVGGIMALVIVSPVVKRLQTRQKSLGFFAVISLLLLIMRIFAGEDFDLTAKTDSKENYGIKDALKEKFNRIYPFSYSGILTFYVVMLTIFPVSGLGAVAGSTLSTLTALGGILGTILSIFLAKKYFKRLPVIRISGLLVTAFGFLLINSKSAAVQSTAAVLIGIFMFLPMTSLVLIPQEIKGMNAAKLTTISGIFRAFSYIIETAVYYLIGITVDKSGYKAALLFAVLFSLTFFIGSFLLPETGEK